MLDSKPITFWQFHQKKLQNRPKCIIQNQTDFQQFMKKLQNRPGQPNTFSAIFMKKIAQSAKQAGIETNRRFSTILRKNCKTGRANQTRFFSNFTKKIAKQAKSFMQNETGSQQFLRKKIAQSAKQAGIALKTKHRFSAILRNIAKSAKKGIPSQTGFQPFHERLQYRPKEAFQAK